MNSPALVTDVVVLMHGQVLAAARFARVEFHDGRDEALTAPLLSAPAAVPDVLRRAPAPCVNVASAAPASAAPKCLGKEIAVQYPKHSALRRPMVTKREREQRHTGIRVEVVESGRIDHFTIVNSTGSTRLEAAARTAVESWRYGPAHLNGQPWRAATLQSLASMDDRQ